MLVSHLFEMPILIGFFGGFFVFVFAIALVIGIMFLYTIYVMPILLNFLPKMKRIVMYKLGGLTIFLVGLLFSRIATWIFPFLGTDIVGIIYYVLLIVAYMLFFMAYYSNAFRYDTCPSCNKWNSAVLTETSLGVSLVTKTKEFDKIKHTYHGTELVKSETIGTEKYQRTDEVETYLEHKKCIYCGEDWQNEKDRILSIGKEIKKWF